ncbi:PREDICTED: tctex1 domain-containing protein 1 [Sturnus vulgaris]|uniref:tctex1 domain-containing protein 1 n=1 Tax=Sturnus vulgaris TaxID=9172 RepID=UPI00071A855F|nr:PREDICTED: tctex1 domain-containing protein 1 [Sturnus vulgaris]
MRRDQEWAGGPRSPPQLRAMEGGESPCRPGSVELCLAGPGGRFPAAAVEEILREELGSALRERRYEPGPCRQAACDIAQAVKARVKALAVPRYKIVVVAHVGQLGEQSLQISSRCLWDPGSDTFSSCVFKNTSLFAVASVYGVYFE